MHGCSCNYPLAAPACAKECDPRPHSRMTHRRQSGAWLSSSTRSARLPHLAQRRRCSTVAKVMPGGRSHMKTALAGHLPQLLMRVRHGQQPRQVTTRHQPAKSAAVVPITAPCSLRWLMLADMRPGLISCLPGARGRVRRHDRITIEAGQPACDRLGSRWVLGWVEA